ncbi:hypothetical protein RHM66_05105 [Pseudomonas sp. RTB3]|nr:hypothetical protein RHM66_05105 [Pseudomonas sp. RTB3]
MSSCRAVVSDASTFTPPSARRPLAMPTTRTRWPLMVAASPRLTPRLSRSARSTITAPGSSRRARRSVDSTRSNIRPCGPASIPDTNTDTPPVSRAPRQSASTQRNGSTRTTSASMRKRISTPASMGLPRLTLWVPG